MKDKENYREVIDRTGKTISSASQGSGSDSSTVAVIDSFPFSFAFESDEAESSIQLCTWNQRKETFVSPLILQSFYSHSSANDCSYQSEGDTAKESEKHMMTSFIKSSRVYTWQNTPDVYASSQHWNDWWTILIQIVNSHTLICNKNGHCAQCYKRQCNS